MKIHFLGGAATVTGSKFLVEHNGIRILIDCGMFQGTKELRLLNWEPFPIAPATIDYVLLTHGHLDHCGMLPRLVKDGFRGKIYCTRPTKEITRLILMDSAKIHEDDAKKANVEHYSRHNSALPLYTLQDTERVTPYFRVVHLEEEIQLSADINFHFFYAGHIIGACSIQLKVANEILVFSGDIGQRDDFLMYTPKKPTEADYVFIESTYGDRLHPETDLKSELEYVISSTVAKGGNVIIPSFAVERAQLLMYLIWQLRLEKQIPDIPYILDTPMGVKALDVFMKNTQWHRLNPYECSEMAKTFRLVTDFEETLDTIFDEQPKVIIAASGMITGGRVLTYLEQYIGKPENTVILAGFQAEGTRGRKLEEGEKEIKFYGRYFPVRANILKINGLSAHGDQGDLLDWLSDLKKPPKKVFLIHGEKSAMETFSLKIQETLCFKTAIPERGTTLELPTQ